MDALFIGNDPQNGEVSVELYQHMFGSTCGQGAEYTQAHAVGSHIPAGLFVAYSPAYMSATDGSCVTKSVILPDATGANLIHNDKMTAFEDEIEDAKCDGLFKFVGVAAVSDDCKDMCEVTACCPFGYVGPQEYNYWSRLSLIDIIKKGPVIVNNVTDIAMCDELHVIIDQESEDECSQLGAITNVAGANTQPLDPSSYEINSPATAGNGVCITLK